MAKPILCLDFDGVLHSYTSGWVADDVVADPPVPGAMEFLRDAVEDFTVAVYSSRSGQAGGIRAMQEWMQFHLDMSLGDADISTETFDALTWPTEKPPAKITIDDRAITFTGEWPAISDLLAFEPWNKPQPAPLIKTGSVVGLVREAFRAGQRAARPPITPERLLDDLFAAWDSTSGIEAPPHCFNLRALCDRLNHPLLVVPVEMHADDLAVR